MFSDFGHNTIEVDEMALQLLPTEMNNASILVATADKANEMLQLK